MNKIIEKLEIKDSIIEFKHPKVESTFKCLIVNKEKIVFLTEVEKINDIKEYTLILPTLKDEILKRLCNTNENKYVTREGNLESNDEVVTIPAFLWDLYVVAFYNVGNRELFDVSSIEEIKRDSFIARKIFIEYDEKNLDSLKKEFENTIYPHSLIRDSLNEIKPSTWDSRTILDDIDQTLINEIFGSKEIDNKSIAIDEVMQKFNDIIKDYIDKK